MVLKKETAPKHGQSARIAILSGAVLMLAAVIVRGQIQFDRPKAEKPLPNPMIITAARDDVRKVARQLLETREIALEKEDCNPQSGECVLITRPVVFIKGIATRSQLEHYCEVPAATVRNWAEGRYVLRINISPANPQTSQVGISAKFEGKTEGVVGNEWVPLASRGQLEDKLLRCLDERARGGECKSESEDR